MVRAMKITPPRLINNLTNNQRQTRLPNQSSNQHHQQRNSQNRSFFARLKRQWQVIDEKQPDTIQPYDRFGISIGRWRPMPFVRNDAHGHDLRVLLRLDGNGKILPKNCDWVLEIPLTEHQNLAQRFERIASRLTGPLKPGQPLVAALPKWQRSWHSGKASWQEMRPGMGWLGGVSADQAAALKQWLEAEPRTPLVHEWCQALLSSPLP